MQPGGSADISYAGTAEGATTFGNPDWANEAWAAFYNDVFVDGQDPLVSPAPCFIESTCPSTWPDPWSRVPAGYHPANLASLQVKQVETNQVVIDFIAPNWGNVGSNFPVTISGSGFGRSPTVNFSGTGVTMSYASRNDTAITGTITIAGSAPLGTQNVTVTNTNVNVTSAPASFVVTPVGPIIDSVSPGTGLVGNSVGVTIAGAGFGSGSVVSVTGNVAASNVSVDSATQITATFAIPANASSGGEQSVTVTSPPNLTSNSKTFHVQIPAKIVRLDYPGAPGGVGPLQVLYPANNSCPVYTLGGTEEYSNECGVYRNYAFDIEESNGTSIDGTYILTETFANYSTTVSGLTAPPTKNFSFVGDGNVSDIQLFAKSAPTCPGTDDNESFDMHFAVSAGGTAFTLTTVEHVDRGLFNGTPEVNATITTP